MTSDEAAEAQRWLMRVADYLNEEESDENEAYYWLGRITAFVGSPDRTYEDEE